MKIKTSELIGRPLDYAVIIANGWEDDYRKYGFALGAGDSTYEPSTDWAQGGPILVEDMIMYSYAFGLFWTWLNDDPEGDRNPRASGPTLLVAIARCRVASKLGDEVDIPEELLQ